MANQPKRGSGSSVVVRAIAGAGTELTAWARADGLCQHCATRGRVVYWYKGTLFGHTAQPGYGDLALCDSCAASLRGCVEAASAYVRAIRACGGQARKSLSPRTVSG